MNDIEQINRQINIINNPLSSNTRHRRSQRQRISPSPEPQLISTINQPSTLALPHTVHMLTTTDTKTTQLFSPTSIVLLPPDTTSNSLLDRSNMTHNQLQTPNIVAQQKLALSDSLNNASKDNDINTLNLLRKKNLSTSDLDPFERRRQVALAKAEGKLEKAQQLYHIAQQSVEQNLSEFLRMTAIPGILNESKTTNAAYEKRIRKLQETKKELEKKITNYQSDIARIQAGDIPNRYTSSKDILHNMNNKFSNENSEQNLIHDLATPTTNEQSTSSHHLDTDNHPMSTNHLTPSINHSTGNGNHNQNLLSLSQNSNTLEPIRSSPSSSISNEIGNSQFYIDLTSDLSALHDIEKSPSTKRRLTNDSNVDLNDRASDQSSDDRFVSYNTSKRNTMTTIEYQQLMLKMDLMQKAFDRSEGRMTDLQRQIDSLIIINDSQRDHNQRLNMELMDLTEVHQNEMSVMKKDFKILEQLLLYKFNEYWSEMIEKLDKLDTRTTKVEQTQAHSFETEENTHRLISKFVNILLTVFAIILLLLSTIKNLVQSRVHAVILLILVFTWIAFHYLPEDYFQSPFVTNVSNIFKRT